MSGAGPKAARPTPGSGDFGLLADTPLVEVETHLRARDVPVEEGPVVRTGALGPFRSLYVPDPDGNLVEIANDEPS